MRIVYVSNEYPPQTGFGGIGTYTFYLAHAMAQRGHEVHVICRSADGAASLQHGAVTIHYSGPGTYPLPQMKAAFFFRLLCYLLIPHSLQRLAWASAAGKLLETIISQTGKVDIVEYPECGAEGFFISRKKSSRTIVRLHTSWTLVRALDKIREPFFDAMVISYLEKKSIQQSNGCSAPSNAIVRITPHRPLCPVPAIIANPLATAGFSPSTGNDWIYTGRIEFRKGIHVLIAAYAQLCTTQEPPLLRLIGRPFGRMPTGQSYEQYIQTMIVQNKLEKKIEWIKGTDRAGVQKYLMKSGVAIFPSVWENYPYSCLEAMACSLVVIAADCGGFPEIITHTENGFLFKSGDSLSLASTLAQCLHKPAINHLGLAARQWVEVHCESSRIAEPFEALYRQTIHGLPA